MFFAVRGLHSSHAKHNTSDADTSGSLYQEEDISNRFNRLFRDKTSNWWACLQPSTRAAKLCSCSSTFTKAQLVESGCFSTVGMISVGSRNRSMMINLQNKSKQRTNNPIRLTFKTHLKNRSSLVRGSQPWITMSFSQLFADDVLSGKSR